MTGNDLNDLLVQLISRLENMGLTGGGLHSSTNYNVNVTSKTHVSFVPNTTHVANVIPPSFQPQAHGTISHFGPTTGTYHPGPLYTQSAQQQVPPPTLAQKQVLGSVQAPLAQPTQPPGYMGSNTVSGHATTLPHAFNIETRQDLVSGAWNMDTGASSHLNSSITSLNDVINTCMYPSISVGDGHSIPVTNTDHSILPTPFKSLHLNNILITPRIIKKLISVYHTRDLYAVTAPSPIPHAFFVSQHTWHQRLGHPEGEVLRHLVSSNFISYNKEKPLVLCHACQLGKHVRLPFVSSSTVINSCFDIIHSDVWTSPIPSLSGLFLSQKKYASEILERAHMVNCNPSQTPVDTESKLRADGDPDGGERDFKLISWRSGMVGFILGHNRHPLGFLEKLEWWFEQDIDKEEVRFEGDEDGDEV
ncbi:ribonuclease H-like domain-containing protein [Tanacetum coccineum]